MKIYANIEDFYEKISEILIGDNVGQGLWLFVFFCLIWKKNSDIQMSKKLEKYRILVNVVIFTNFVPLKILADENCFEDKASKNFFGEYEEA